MKQPIVRIVWKWVHLPSPKKVLVSACAGGPRKAGDIHNTSISVLDIFQNNINRYLKST